MIKKTRLGVVRQLAGIVGFVGVLLATPSALASPVFPGAIQQAAHMPCAPGCLLCHTSSPGTAATWMTKKLPIALFETGLVKAGDAGSLETAFAAFAAKPENAAAVSALAQGDDPQTGMSVCGPEYGCSMRFARRPSTNALISIFLGLAFALALARSFRRGRR
jgi:hypothetical protein